MKLALCFALVGQLTACRKPSAQDLVGTWEVAYANSKLKLKLNQDGTFEQLLEQKDKTTVLRRTGKWEMTDLEGESVVLNGHALMDEPTLDIEDAKFMLISCSAFVNYLVVKAQKAGIAI